MKFWEKRVYADAAASTPLSGSVVREIRRLEGLYGNPGGLHEEAVAAKKELESARKRAGEALGAHSDEIFFTSGGTESNNLAIFGTLRALLHEHGELHAVTTLIEHPSVLEPLRALEREGLYITYLPVDSEGFISIKDLRESINDETVLVSVQMVNSEVGTIQNIKEVAKEVRHAQKSRHSASSLLSASKRGPSRLVRETAPSLLPLYLHTDASQAPLWLSLNVEKLGVDLMALDAQKMLGPKSAGLLYVRRGTKLEPVIFGGGQEQGLRSGTENVVLAGATATALVEAQKSCELNAEHTRDVRNYLWGEIKKALPDAVMHGPEKGERVANNLSISVPGLDGQMAVIALDRNGVAASTRSACSAADEEPSHVLRALQVAPQTMQETIRLSLLPTAGKSEARVVARALTKVAKRYRNMVK